MVDPVKNYKLDSCHQAPRGQHSETRSALFALEEKTFFSELLNSTRIMLLDIMDPLKHACCRYSLNVCNATVELLPYFHIRQKTEHYSVLHLI